MIKKSLARLDYLINTVPALLSEIDDEKMSLKLGPEKWSQKEILGHLIDSATNNHQRFVRGQFEIEPEIVYNQNEWNKFNFYQEIESSQIISFWTVYNKHMLEVIKRIPAENLDKKIKIGEELVSLEFLIIDYVKHIEHHLVQLVNY